jgi:hypothetical protein
VYSAQRAITMKELCSEMPSLFPARVSEKYQEDSSPKCSLAEEPLSTPLGRLSTYLARFCLYPIDFRTEQTLNSVGDVEKSHERQYLKFEMRILVTPQGVRTQIC